jgi:hypothetical protein
MALRLHQGGYRVARAAQLPDGTLADIAASRTYFSWKGLVVISQHVVIRRMENATVADMQALFQQGFRFGKKRNWIPLVRGLQLGYMVLPVIITANPRTELVQYAGAPPRKHWALFEFPIVVNETTGQADYFRGTPLWGAFFFSDMRSVAAKFIEGAS